MKVSSIRSRWAAVGAAVAVSLGAGGIGITHATTSSGEKPVYIPLDSPCRLADNRPAGIGPDASVTFDGWGTVGDCTLPTGTAGLALNVTAVDATQQTNLRFYPADTAVPGTANLNPTPGAPPIPNAVNVSLAAADGKFKVYNRFGNVAVIIDVMGVYDDHNHDDRYYTEAEVDAALALKADPPTHIPLSFFAFEESSSGSTWTRGLGFQHSVSGTDECIFATADVPAGSTVNAVDFATIQSGAIQLDGYVALIRTTSGSFTGLPDLLIELANVQDSPRGATPASMLSSFEPTLTPTVVPAGYDLYVSLCSSDSVNLWGATVEVS